MVNIILAAYNGGKHITRQLRSLADQTYGEITVWIRDDGSSDDTVEIIRRFAAEDHGSKRFILMEPDGRNLGVPEAFYEILRKCEPAEYYALCDQDDYWYPEKVSRAVAMLEKEADPETPAVYFSRCSYQDEEGNVLRESARQEQPTPLSRVIYHTPASGFTCVFNEALRKKMILDHRPGKELHDRYLIRGAVCFGKTIYDDNCTAAHIRHAGAVTSGDSDYRSLLRHFIRNEILGASAKEEKQWIAEFYRIFGDELAEEDGKVLKLFSAEKGGIGLWARKLFYPARLRSSLPGEIALRLLFLTNRI